LISSLRIRLVTDIDLHVNEFELINTFECLKHVIYNVDSLLFRLNWDQSFHSINSIVLLNGRCAHLLLLRNLRNRALSLLLLVNREIIDICAPTKALINSHWKIWLSLNYLSLRKRHILATWFLLDRRLISGIEILPSSLFRRSLLHRGIFNLLTTFRLYI